MGLTFRYLWVLAGSMYLAFCRSATFLCGLLSSKPSCTTVSTGRSPFSTDLHLGKVFFCSLFPFLQGILGFKKVPSKSLAMTASWRPFGGSVPPPFSQEAKAKWDLGFQGSRKYVAPYPCFCTKWTLHYLQRLFMGRLFTTWFYQQNAFPAYFKVGQRCKKALTRKYHIAKVLCLFFIKGHFVPPTTREAFSLASAQCLDFWLNILREDLWFLSNRNTLWKCKLVKVYFLYFPLDGRLLTLKFLIYIEPSGFYFFNGSRTMTLQRFTTTFKVSRTSMSLFFAA